MGFKFLNFNEYFLGGGGGVENEYFGSLKILWIFLGQLEWFWGHFCDFKFFS